MEFYYNDLVRNIKKTHSVTKLFFIFYCVCLISKLIHFIFTSNYRRFSTCCDSVINKKCNKVKQRENNDEPNNVFFHLFMSYARLN